jgi:signal transduction histidine kinase
LKARIHAVKRKSIRSRMLAIALVPSLVVLVIGLAIAGYLVDQGMKTDRWAQDLKDAVAPGSGIVNDVQLERWLSLVQLGGGPVDQAQLAAQRGKVDADIGRLQSDTSSTPTLADVLAPSGVADSPWAQLPEIRKNVDSGQIGLLPAYDYYGQLLAPIADYVAALAGQAPNSAIENEQMTASAIYTATEEVARANALAFAAAIRGGMDGPEFAEFARQVGAYQVAVETVRPKMTPGERAEYSALTASPEWQQLVSVQNTLISQGPMPAGAKPKTGLTISQADWQNDTLAATGRLLAVFGSHFSYAASMATDDGRSTLYRALGAGLVIVLLGILVLVVAVRMSNGVVRRLLRLRAETLSVADEHLPRIVGQLRAGVPVDVERELPALSHGADEIGQVAEAFNKAQHTAVAAAVEETRTRQGANEVFLNIAQRSQAVANRQLGVLDLAERRQDDPQQVQFLFQLDHLATRARRNAENLIILGGGRSVRQWRHGVVLRDVVRAAIGETEHFTRITILRLPAVTVAGPAVADLTHLLAELLDNATAFAPPEARAEVRGNLVGSGAVIEIEDQGLSIAPEAREMLNAALLAPPDYGVLALSSDSRLGLFVVARLAARHGIRVSLAESAYGGTRAIVLLPDALLDESGSLATEPMDPPVWPSAEPVGADLPDAMSTEDVATMVIIGPTEPESVPEPVNGASANGMPAHSANGVDAAGADSDDGLPPLPRRRRQTHLVAQLRAGAAAPAVQPEEDSDRSPEQVRSAISAFQRGTRRARRLDQEAGAPGAE